MKTLSIVPTQKEGTKSDTEHSVDCSSLKEAARRFTVSAARLLNVNEWHHFSGLISAEFKLTDKNGNGVNRSAALGDFFRIDIPGPGSSAGQGYDWVKIESMNDFRDPTGEIEEVSFRVRPAPSPAGSNETAHFFSDHATSTFMVSRNGTIVTAAVHGRNEAPNTETATAGDKIRNAVVALGAISGLSKIQWKSLVEGLLEGRNKTGGSGIL